MAVQNRELHRMLLVQQERAMTMTESRFVLEHLQRQGIAPYLPLASERMTKDIDSICQRFGLTEEQAIAWIFNQVVPAKDDDSGQ